MLCGGSAFQIRNYEILEIYDSLDDALCMIFILV